WRKFEISGTISRGAPFDGSQYVFIVSPTAAREVAGLLAGPQSHRPLGAFLYSLTILSAHSTNATKSGGVTNRAFLPSRSVSRTARAREHAVQMLSGILCPIVSCII